MPAFEIWLESEYHAACAMALRWIANGGPIVSDCGAYDNGRATKTAAYKALADDGAPGRTWKAVERKIGNASAVLRDAGLDSVPGHASGNTNYQACMIDALAIALRQPLPKFLAAVNKGRIARGAKPFTIEQIEAELAELESAAIDERPAAPLSKV